MSRFGEIRENSNSSPLPTVVSGLIDSTLRDYGMYGKATGSSDVPIEGAPGIVLRPMEIVNRLNYLLEPKRSGALKTAMGYLEEQVRESEESQDQRIEQVCYFSIDAAARFCLDFLRRQQESNELNPEKDSRSRLLPVSADLLKKVRRQDPNFERLMKETEVFLGANGENPFLMDAVIKAFDLVAQHTQRAMKSEGEKQFAEKWARMTVLVVYGLLRKAALFEGEPDWFE